MKSFARWRKPRDTTPPRTSLQEGGRTLKTLGSFHVRKNLADKRKDHAVLILSAKDRTECNAILIGPCPAPLIFPASCSSAPSALFPAALTLRCAPFVR